MNRWGGGIDPDSWSNSNIPPLKIVDRILVPPPKFWCQILISKCLPKEKNLKGLPEEKICFWYFHHPPSRLLMVVVSLVINIESLISSVATKMHAVWSKRSVYNSTLKKYTNHIVELYGFVLYTLYLLLPSLVNSCHFVWNLPEKGIHWMSASYSSQSREVFFCLVHHSCGCKQLSRAKQKAVFPKSPSLRCLIWILFDSIDSSAYCKTATFLHLVRGFMQRSRIWVPALFAIGKTWSMRFTGSISKNLTWFT